MKTFAEFNVDEQEEVIPVESNATKRHKVKEQLSRIDPQNWEEFDDDFERFEKFKARK